MRLRLHSDDELPSRGNRLVRAAVAFLLRITGWRIEGEVPRVPKLIVAGAPHSSNWDFVLTLACALALGVRVSWVGKHTLFRGPMGPFMRWTGGVSVNRNGRQGFVDAMIEEFRQRPKFVLAVMPQGTRKAVKWKTGFYHIARGANIPVVPVAFDYGCKTLRFGPLLVPSGDMAHDMAQIQSHFIGVRGKYPARDEQQL